MEKCLYFIKTKIVSGHATLIEKFPPAMKKKQHSQNNIKVWQLPEVTA